MTDAAIYSAVGGAVSVALLAGAFRFELADRDSPSDVAATSAICFLIGASWPLMLAFAPLFGFVWLVGFVVARVVPPRKRGGREW